MVIGGAVITRRRYPTANVARQAMLTYRVGVAHLGVQQTHFTCRLTAKNWDQPRNPTLGNRVWATFAFLHVQF